MSDRNSDLLARYRRVRCATEALAEPLSAEDQGLQSMPDASPVKWHRAHTTWFFDTFVLAPVGRGAPVDPLFAHLFNSYYNSVGAQHPRSRRGLLSRPSCGEVARYRELVDERVERALSEGALDEAALDVVELGLAHEQQHQELILTDVKHGLAQSPLDPAYLKASAPAGARHPSFTWHAFESGLCDIGHDGRGFAFDNEGPRHRCYIEDFELASRPATNGEYLAFMDDDGYARPELWLAEGLDWVVRERIEAPLYWRREAGGGFTQMTLTGRRAVEPAEPVTHISYFEADAFARWSGARLPREAEWEVAARLHSPWGNFVESRCFHPAPAATGRALTQLYGDVWEWTQSPYVAYPGYRPGAGALGEYNGKFMSSQYVLRGGSCATPEGHVRPTYRNFFPPQARWQFSGVRLARDV